MVLTGAAIEVAFRLVAPPHARHEGLQPSETARAIG
jgi:hypothetical protein